MKILCVIDSLGSGGAQRQLVNLAISFKKNGHDVDFLIYYNDDFYSDILNKNDINIISIFEENYIKRILKIRSHIRSSKYQSIVSFLETPSLLCVLAGFPSKNWKLIIGERSADPKILSSKKLKFYRLFHFFADEVVANSFENIEMVKKVNPFLIDSKCHVIYNSVNFNHWNPKKQNYEFRENNKLNIIVAARHHHLKNLNILIEAINLLNENQRNQLNIKWYGREEDDSLQQGLMKIKKYKLEQVFNFFEPIHNIYDEVNKADVVGLFSFYEGLPNTVCEAMINAKVVISSDVSDIKRLVDKDFIFNANDQERLRDVLVYILNMNKFDFERIGNKNREIALELFDENNICNSYLSLMD